MPQQPSLVLSLPQRLYLATAILLCVVMAVTGIALYSITQLSQIADSAGRAAGQERLYAALDRLAAEQAAAVFAFFAGKDDGGTVDAVKDTLEGIHEEGRRALAESADPDVFIYAIYAERTKIAETLWKKCHESAVTFVSGGSTEEWTAEREKFIEFVREIVEVCALSTQSIREEAAQIPELYTHILTIVTTVGVFFAVVIACVVVSAMLKSLRRIVDSLLEISEQARSFADGGTGSAQPDPAAVSASVADAAEELSRILNGQGKARRAVGNGTPQSDALARQYADWANLPADVRAALLILARRLGETRDDQ